MKAMIIGATGLLGKPLMREWRGADLMGTGSCDLDIRDARAVGDLIEKKHPDWIVLAAAYTDVDGCESNSELAFTVNRDGAVNVANACKASGVKLLFISSDYVFDGTKNLPYDADDQRNPQSVYGVAPKPKRNCVCWKSCPTVASFERLGSTEWEESVFQIRF